MELQPLFRWRMERSVGTCSTTSVPGSVAARGGRRTRLYGRRTGRRNYRRPLAASQLSEPRRRAGEWWDRRSLGRVALKLLFGDGVLAVWRAPNFERVYDLTERVIPADVLALPTPAPEDAQRELIALAARCMGVATVADLADYFWMRVPAARPRVAELVEDGHLTKTAVEGWSQPAYLPVGARSRALRRRDQIRFPLSIHSYWPCRVQSGFSISIIELRFTSPVPTVPTAITSCPCYGAIN